MQGSSSKRLAMIMSTEVGLRTQYMSWREHFPDDCGIEPVWIVIDFRKESGLIERLPLPSGIQGRIRGQLEVAEALKKGPYDGIFVAVHSALAMFSRVLDRTPCFMTFDVTPKQLHDFGPIYGKAPSRFRSLERFKHERRALAYRKCKLLFPWSRWAAQSAIDDYGAQPSRIHVIPPGVDIDRWNPGERFERPAKPVCDLLFVGGDFERKGGDLLLEWVLRSKRSDFVLHLVTRKRLDQFADPRIRVYNDLMPNDSCLVKLYSTADIFVLPTRADCYSLAGIEAMASGLPVIVGQTGGTGDIIRHGETGLLIGTNDMESLGESLDRLIADFDLRRRIGMAAREDAVARYNGRRNIRESVELMRAEL